ncbi:MAG: M20/M25/M40 family metallo-hydrolase [Luteibaculum sp.]
MRKNLKAFTLLFISAFFLGQVTKAAFQVGDSTAAQKILARANEQHSFEMLRQLTKDIGPRLSGSKNAEKAVLWGLETFKELGFDSAWIQPVMVPHWERGEPEQARWLNENKPFQITALGGSVGTPTEGITAEVVEVKNFKELKDLGVEGIKGKVVFYNRPMDPKLKNTFRAYSLAVDQRSDGAWQAAQYGAQAVLVRSMTTATDLNPHTGTMNYIDSIQKIPAFAISTEDANALSKGLAKAPQKVWLKANCQWFPDAESHNVVGELKGKSEKIILVGGHLDSWDLGEGAHDDGAGIVHAIDALRILKAMNYEPNYTLRAVLFMNEENGARGGLEYAEQAALNSEKHVIAIESDRGGFQAEAFSVQGNANQLEKLKRFGSELVKTGIKEVYAGYGGVDISFLQEVDSNTVLVGLVPDPEKYFNYHHTAQDILENVNPKELASGAAALAYFIYLCDQRNW